MELPADVSFEVGAGLEVPWMTACRAVNYRPIQQAEESMRISGDAGSVGFYAIQLAKLAGFRVITTVSSPQKAALAATAGPDLVVNYKTG